MKIAIPTRGDRVDDHFGHCELYSLYTIGADRSVLQREYLPSPQGCGCKSNLSTLLKALGVTHMLAGSMGTGALNMLHAQGIEVIRGCNGEVEQVLKEYLAGQITDSGEGCHQHEHHHAQGHECRNE